MALSEAQAIEVFHLSFLQVLQRRFDPARYVLKGGANLRYFFDSVRYSEDIDLDLVGADPWRLEDKVDDVLDSPALRRILLSAGLAIEESSKPKQTETTRRWKVGIDVDGRSDPIRTRIEFSNRNREGQFALEAVPSRIVDPYALRAPKLQHYELEPATEQKVEALIGRSEPQARDVFDLDALLHRKPLQRGTADPELLEKAADQALELPFDAFRDQVLPFLDPEVAELYDEDAWEQMQLYVAEKLRDAQ